jgi:Escherichia/Staphylococcus phage prohead protease
MTNKYLDFPFEIKATNVKENGTFTGYGSVFGNKDSHSDVVMPGAFSKSLAKGGRNGSGVAMLLHHDTRRPIGVWTNIFEDKRGLKVEGQLAMKTKDGKETYELMKMGALRGLSIGYDTVIHETDDKKKLRYLKEIELWEISPVVFGSNLLATVQSVKNNSIQIKAMGNDMAQEIIVLSEKIKSLETNDPKIGDQFIKVAEIINQRLKTIDSLMNDDAIEQLNEIEKTIKERIMKSQEKEPIKIWEIFKPKPAPKQKVVLTEDERALY